MLLLRESWVRLTEYCFDSYAVNPISRDDKVTGSHVARVQSDSGGLRVLS